MASRVASENTTNAGTDACADRPFRQVRSASISSGSAVDGHFTQRPILISAGAERPAAAGPAPAGRSAPARARGVRGQAGEEPASPTGTPATRRPGQRPRQGKPGAGSRHADVQQSAFLLDLLFRLGVLDR